MADTRERTVDATTKRLLEEHEEIRQAMAGLQATRDLRVLIQRLQAFRSLVTAHFLAEVAPGGFFDALRTRAACHFGRLAELEGEHGTLLEDIARLDGAARACLAGPVADVLAGATALVQRFGDHETSETALFMDSLYTDVGES